MKLFAHLCLLVTAFLPQQVLACKVDQSFLNKHKIPTESEQFARADLVFIGAVVEMKEARQVDGVSQPPYTFLYKVKVEKWLKGSGESLVQVVDSAGTDCDTVFGISHISVEPGTLPSLRWRVFARMSNGRAWVTMAGNTR